MSSKRFFLLLLSALLGISFSTKAQTKTVLTMVTKGPAKIVLIMENSVFHYEGFSRVTWSPGANVSQQHDSLIILFSRFLKTDSVRWSLKRDSTGTRLEGIMKINPEHTFTVADSQNFTLEVKQDSVDCEEWVTFDRIIAYSMLPGGIKFQTGHPWQGLALGILQVTPIPFAIHYNYQRLKYFDRAREAAKRGDRPARDENFDKSQDYALRVGIALGITAVAYVINTFDVFKNIKKIQCQPVVHGDGLRLEISKEL